MNEICSLYFADVPPSMSDFRVSRLPEEAMVEIEAKAFDSDA